MSLAILHRPRSFETGRRDLYSLDSAECPEQHPIREPFFFQMPLQLHKVPRAAPNCSDSTSKPRWKLIGDVSSIRHTTLFHIQCPVNLSDLMSESTSTSRCWPCVATR